MAPSPDAIPLATIAARALITPAEDRRGIEGTMGVTLRRLALFALLLAFVGGAVWKGEAFWWWATTKTMYSRYYDPIARTEAIGQSRGQHWFGLPGADGTLRVWSVSTGKVIILWTEDLSNGIDVFTRWHPSGTVSFQGSPVGVSSRSQPPWLSGVTDQVKPSAPWVLEGVTADEWWNRLPEDSRTESPKPEVAPSRELR